MIKPSVNNKRSLKINTIVPIQN